MNKDDILFDIHTKVTKIATQIETMFPDGTSHCAVNEEKIKRNTSWINRGIGVGVFIVTSLITILIRGAING